MMGVNVRMTVCTEAVLRMTDYAMSYSETLTNILNEVCVKKGKKA
jgi:hypothetical protein